MAGRAKSLAGVVGDFDLVLLGFALGAFQILLILLLPLIDVHQTRRVLGDGRT